MSHSNEIFVGSSTEATDHYDQVCTFLEELGYVPRGWKGAFQKGQNFIDELFRLASDVDAALLIATPDDLVHSRGTDRLAPRDNVLFELGLFNGVLGKANAALVLAGNGSQVKLPSDLDGVNYFAYRDSMPNSFKTELRRWLENAVALSAISRPERNLARQMRMMPIYFKVEAGKWLFPKVSNLIERAARGLLELSPQQYFERIKTNIENAAVGTQVIAVATHMSAVRWASDPIQSRYMSLNFDAHRRGAKIRRLFVFDKVNVSPEEVDSILTHLKKGVPVRCITRTALHSNLEDYVLFEGREGQKVAFKAFAHQAMSERVVTAEMIIDDQRCVDLKRTFEDVWSTAWEPVIVGNAIEIPGMRPFVPVRKPVAPGVLMESRWTAKAVITCREAAMVRGHSLSRELKSLVVIRERQAPFVVHVPGDWTISLRKVKTFLGISKGVHLADPDQLLDLELGPGIVCAVLDPVWSMLHLIDNGILENEEIFTNNGCRNGYVAFSPNVLRTAEKAYVGDFVGNRESDGGQ